MNILQDIKQNTSTNEFHNSKSVSSKPKKGGGKGAFGTPDIDMHIGITYNQTLKMLQQNRFELKLPENGVKSIEKLQLIQKTVHFLIEKVIAQKGQSKPLGNDNSQMMDQSNIITCADCQQYQSNLQKYQNQVRQHIRLQQQLKIYQESMEEKIEELKKEKAQFQKKNQDYKKKLDDYKQSMSSAVNEKVSKLEFQNQKLKAEVKNLKQHPMEHSKKIKGYESKQNRIDWAHRASSIGKKEQVPKDAKTDHRQDRNERKSIDKRGDSSDRWRMSSTNARSVKTLHPHFNEKLIQQKNREDRKKAIQSKFQYRR